MPSIHRRWSWGSALGVIARLLVGGVWIWAGWIKIDNIPSSVTAVRAYQLLPLSTTEFVGQVLPPIELAVGVCLVLGVLTRFFGGVSALLQVAFIIGIASVWARGIPIDCGCFGDGGATTEEKAFAAYPWEIARDAGLGLLSLWLVFGPRTPYALDNVLFPRRKEDDGQEED